MSVSWNPWHGCQRVSEGCRECYVYRQDAAWQKDGGHVVKTTAFSLPVRRSRDGRWKIPAGEMVFTCFTSDFLLAEADVWRREAWEMIRLRRDLHFMFFTKRIDRLSECLPGDWGCRVRACDDRLHGGESADGRLSAADFPEVADSSQDYRLRPADRSHRFGPVSRTGNRTGICRRRVGSRSACLRLCLGALPAGSVCGTRCFLLLSPDRGASAQGRTSVPDSAAVSAYAGSESRDRF